MSGYVLAPFSCYVSFCTTSAVNKDTIQHNTMGIYAEMWHIDQSVHRGLKPKGPWGHCFNLTLQYVIN